MEFVASKGAFNNEVVYTGLIRDVSETVQTKRSKNRLMSKLVGAQQSQFYAGMCKQSIPILRNLAGRIHDLSEELPRIMPDPRLKTLARDAQEILHVTDDLRHVETKGTLPVSPVKLTEFLEAYLEQTASNAPYPEFSETKISADLETTALASLVAPSAFEQVLDSLLLLACRENVREEGVVVKFLSTYLDQPLTGTEVVPAGEYLVTHILDNGNGLPENELDHFFEGRDRKYEDIDLALTESIVRNMGGVLDVDSTLGEGTTLSIYMPIAREIPTDGLPDDPLATVLVVEDHKPMQRMISGFLHKAGYRVIFTETAEQAVNKLKEEPADVILLDLILEKDLQAREYSFRQIHKLFPDLPILVTGGTVDSQVLANVIQEGAAGYIEKPFIPTKLVHMVKRETLTR